jgi:RHS repeat-associated protein
MRTSFSYDLLGRLFSQTDALGHTVRYGYDNADRVTHLTLPSGRTYGFAYDVNGNRTQITMPNGAVHKLGYSVIDLESDYTPPGNLAYSWQYSLDQEWTRTTLPGGRSVDVAYDSGGRPTGIVYPEASIGTLYNDMTDRVSMLNRTPAFGGTTQQTAFTYDGSLVTGQAYSGVSNGAFTFTYDNNFFLRQIGLVSGSNTVTTPIIRDADGLVTGYGTFNFTRGGPAGAVSRITDSASNIVVTYDTLGRVATRTHAVNGMNVYSIQLSYDSTGNISRKIETVSGVQATWDYIYDADGQLVKTKKNDADAETFAYDVNGNRTSYQRPNSLTILSEYDDQDRIVWQGGVTYQLNSDGQLTQRGADTFQYSAMGELLQATANGQSITYGYDGMGRRISRTDSTGTWQYLYGNLNQPFQLTAMRDPAGVLSYYYYDENGKLFAFDKGGTRYYVATDQVGTPKVVSDAAGNTVKFLEFDSFGMWTYDSNPDFELPVGFAGGIIDSQTTLVRFGYRDYEPWSGRWAARDPVFFRGGQGNLFAYVQNNPINRVDPFGLYWFRQSWQKPGVVGRDGTPVPPRGLVSEYIEKYVPAGYPFGELHDDFVDFTKRAGIPDWLANVPSMYPVFSISISKEVLRTLRILKQPTPSGRESTKCK